MASSAKDRHSPSKQARTDNSEQPNKDVHGDGDSPQEPLFFLELEGSRDRADSVTYEADRNLSNNSSNTSWNADDSVFRRVQRERDTSHRQSEAKVHSDSDIVPTPQTSRSRPVPVVQRANSSPVSAVCRPSHSQLVVRCQVNCHPLPHLAFSCPAAFSPAWTWVMPPVSPNKAGSGMAKEQRRRHTVGPASHVDQRRLRQLQQQHQHRGSEGSHHTAFLGLSGRGRSLSDSELQQLLMKEVGRQLRNLSDQFHCSKTGQPLTTVTESEGSSEDDSDDEM